MDWVAIDGTVEEVPDTPENAAVLGRHTGGRGASTFPLVRGVYLCECGTHAIVDAGFWPYHTSERVGGFRMLRLVEPDMLVMWDRGLAEAARGTPYSQEYLSLLARKGRLEAIKRGRNWVTTRRAVEAYLRSVGKLS